MNFSPELILSVIIQLIAIGIFIGVFKTTVAFMQVQIAEIKQNLKDDKQELKAEMQKYNSVLERMIIVEQSTKSAHKREDEMNIRVSKLEQK
jgi:predicted Holliday junction resolvase-like endonuclease